MAAFFAACGWLFVSSAAYAIIDLNANGMSDVWERVQNGGELFPETFLAEEDPDLDGWTNAQEAAAGTDPFNPNPPDGLIRPLTAHIPEVLGVDENEDPIVVTPEAVTVAWPTLVGKQYTLLFSPDLSDWFPVDDAFIGDGDDVLYTFLVSDADSRFWRVQAEDTDTDEDGKTDYEEAELADEKYLTDLDGDGLTALEEIYLGTNTHLWDTDGDLVSDGLEVFLGTSPLLNNAADDDDSDGMNNAEEYLAGRDPAVADPVSDASSRSLDVFNLTSF